MRIAAVDPGLMTGVAVVSFDETGCAASMTAEFPFDSMLGWCREHLPDADRIAVERFTITPQTAKNSAAPWSLHVIGVVLASAIDVERDHVLELQKPADAMTVVPNERLHSIDLWHRGGAGHANDALRHAVLCALRHGWRHPRFLSGSF
jgi:hypothetical protein